MSALLAADSFFHTTSVVFALAVLVFAVVLLLVARR